MGYGNRPDRTQTSRRFGKTRLMLTAGIEECLKNPGAKIFYLAPSRKQAKDIA
tara:strand:- start:396 stop:554 length:159 start_codon:yes stop_codon:yes gene_type:complete